MRRSRLFVLFLSAAVLAAISIRFRGCAEDAGRRDFDADRLDVLLVTVEKLLPGDLASLEESAWPALAPFSRSGAVFEDTVAASPDPAAAIASLMTSTRPSTHGVRSGRDEPLGEAYTTLADALRAHDFSTAAVIASEMPLASLGLAGGFDSVDDGGGAPNRSAVEVAAAVLSLEPGASDARRRFVWAHFGGEAARDDGGRSIARILESSQRRRATLAIVAGVGVAGAVAADEEPPFPDRAIRVALVVSGPPGFPGRGRRLGEIVSTLDVAPTVLDALELRSGAAFQGVSFYRTLAGDGPVRGHAPIEWCDPFEQPGTATLRGIATRTHLFADLPGEGDLRTRDAAGRASARDASEERPDVVREMRRRLRDPRGGRDRDRSRRGAGTRGAARGSGGEAPTAAPSGSQTAALLAERASALSREGRIGDALDALRDGLDAEPADSRLRVRLGETLLQAGDVASASREAAEALTADPESPLAHALAGHTARLRGDLPAAERAFRRAAELRPRSPGAAADLGHVLLSLGRAEDAAGWFEAALRLDPFSAPGHVALAKSLLAVADAGSPGAARVPVERAVESLRRAAVLAPGLAPPRLLLASLLFERGVEGRPRSENVAEALVHLRAAAEAEPESAAARLRLGEILESTGALAAAADEFRQAVALDPASTEALLGLARTLPSDRRDEAREHLERAVQLSPGLASARRALGENLLASGDSGAGLRQIEEAAFRAPGDPAGWAFLGESLLAGSRPHDAEAAFRRALDADPRHLGARTGLARLLARGIPSEAFPPRPMESIELARSAVTMHPSDPAAVSALAFALDAAGRSGEAVDARLREARLHVVAGRKSEALAALDACGAAAPERVGPLRKEAESIAETPEPSRASATPAD